MVINLLPKINYCMPIKIGIEHHVAHYVAHIDIQNDLLESLIKCL